jgi:hypothetical protein
MLRAECRARGLGWELHASRAMPAAVAARLDARRTFRFSPYVKTEGVGAPELLAAQLFAAGNAVTLEDLRTANPVLSHEDRLLVHTLMANQMLGLAAWYGRLVPPRPPLAMILRFPPDYGMPVVDKALAEAQFAHALAVLARAGVALGADSATLARLVQSHWPRPVTTMPIPLAPAEPLPPDTAGNPARGLHLAYLGEARTEKGFYLLAPTFAAVFARYRNLRATIQCTACPDDLFAPIVAEFARISPAIAVSKETLDGPRYRELIASAHAVLVPYDPADYTYRTSHVLIDALAQGRPVVTTANSWMAAEIKSFGSDALGPIMPCFSVDALESAIDELVSDYSRFAAAATAVAPVVRARHNRRTYLDALFALMDATDGG